MHRSWFSYILSLSVTTIALLSSSAIASTDVETIKDTLPSSFIDTYVSFAVYPKTQEYSLNPYNARVSTHPQFHGTRGWHYSDVTYSKKFLHVKVSDGVAPIAEIFAIPHNQIQHFNLSNLDENFNGNLTHAVGSNPRNEDLMLNITNECYGFKIANSLVVNDMFYHLNCSSQNLQLFFYRPFENSSLNQPFDANMKAVSTDKTEWETPTHLVLIKVINPKEVNVRAPFDTLKNIPLPTNLLSFYLNKIDQSYRLADIKQSLVMLLNEDYKDLRGHMENRLVDEWLNRKNMISYYVQNFQPLSINHGQDSSELVLANHEENSFSGNLTVYATSDKKLVAVAAMVTPALFERNDIYEIVETMRKDTSCIAPKYETVSIWDLEGLKLTCETRFGIEQVQKTYYLFTYPEHDNKGSQRDQPLQLIQINGYTARFDIDDIIFNLQLISDQAWNFNPEQISKYELSVMFNIPHVKEWYNSAKGDGSNLSKPWGKFLSRSTASISKMENRNSEHIRNEMTRIAKEIYSEQEFLKKSED